MVLSESESLYEKIYFDLIFQRREMLIGVGGQGDITLSLTPPIVTSWFMSKDAGPPLSNEFPVLHIAVVEGSDLAPSLGVSCVSGCSGEGMQNLQASPGGPGAMGKSSLYT